MMKGVQYLVSAILLCLIGCENGEPMPSYQVVFEAEAASISSDIILTTDNKFLLLTREGVASYSSKLYKLNTDYSIVWSLALDDYYTTLQQRSNGNYLLSGGSKVASVQTDGLGITFMKDAQLNEFQVFEQSDGKIIGCGENDINRVVQSWTDFGAVLPEFSIVTNTVDFDKNGNSYLGVNTRATELQRFGTGMIPVPITDLVGNPYSQFEAIDFKIDSNGEYYVLGNTQSNVCLSNLALLKFDAFGEKIWIRELGSSGGSDFAGSLTMVDDRVLVSGYYAEKGCTLNVNYTELYVAEVSLKGKVSLELKAGERDVNEGIQKTLLIDGKLIGAGMITESGNSKAVVVEVSRR